MEEKKESILNRSILFLFNFFLGLGGGVLSFLIYLFSRFFMVRSWRFKFDILPTLIIFSFLLSSIFSTYKIFSLGNFTVLLLLYITYLFLRKEGFHRDDIIRMLDYFVLGSMMLAFGGVVGYLYNGFYADTPFLGKNGIGTVLATSIPIVQLSVIFKCEVYHYLFLTFTISGLILTMSQGAWIGLALGELFLLILGDKKIKKSVVMLLLFAVIALIIFTVHSAIVGTNLLSFFYTRLDPYSSSKVERLYIWRASIRMFLDHPITGIGIGTFPLLYPMYKLPEAHEISMSFAHNLPLNLLVETGILGFLSFFAFILSLYKRGLGLYKKTRDNLILVLLSSLTAYLGHQFFDGTMWSLHIGLIFWFIGAIILNFYEEVK